LDNFRNKVSVVEEEKSAVDATTPSEEIEKPTAEVAENNH
jgi:hypothetical protein